MTASRHVMSYVVDYAEERTIQYAGSSEESRVVNASVTGTDDRAEAIAEGQWRARQDAEGDLLSGPTLVTVQGPEDGLDPGTWLVSHRITYLRYW